MSTEELSQEYLNQGMEIPKENNGPRVPDPTKYREEVHELFKSRVPHVMRSRIGRYCIRPRATSNAPTDDITDPDVGFIHADTERTDAALKMFEKAVFNPKTKVSVINDYIDRHGLMDAQSITVLSPHTKIYDTLGASFLFTLSNLRPDRSAEGNIMYLSRGINYLDYEIPIPLFRKSGNVVKDIILPITNEVPVYPETETVEALRKKYREFINNANRNVVKATVEHKSHIRRLGQTAIEFMAPPGKQMVETDKMYFTEQSDRSNLLVCSNGTTVEQASPSPEGKYEPGLAMPLISKGAYGIIEKAHKRGSKVVFVGVDFPVVLAYALARLPLWQGLPLNLKLVDPLPDRKLDRDELETLVDEGLMQVGSRTVKRPIYYKKG